MVKVNVFRGLSFFLVRQSISWLHIHEGGKFGYYLDCCRHLFCVDALCSFKLYLLLLELVIKVHNLLRVGFDRLCAKASFWHHLNELLDKLLHILSVLVLLHDNLPDFLDLLGRFEP